MMEDWAEGLLVLRDAALALLPAGGGTENHAVPDLIEEGLALVVPHGGDGAFCAHALTVADKALNIAQGDVVIGINLEPAVDSRRDPGFEASVGEGLDVFVEAGFGVVPPGDGDEIFRQALDLFGVVHGDVAPEEDFLLQRRELIGNSEQEVDVDGAEAALLHVVVRLAAAKAEGFIGADVDVGSGENLRDFSEP